MSNILIAFLKVRVKKGGKFNIDIASGIFEFDSKTWEIRHQVKITKVGEEQLKGFGRLSVL